MQIMIREESVYELDPALTSALAKEAFQKFGSELSAERFAWTYRRGYDRVTILSAYAEGEKIGQLVCLFKKFVLSGESQTAAELVDLFVSPAYRGYKVASSLYKEMHKVVENERAEVMFAYANEGASVLNRRFFAMEEFTQLPARIGICASSSVRPSSANITVQEDLASIASACINCMPASPVGGVQLTAEELRKRISSPVHRYLSATDGKIAMLASPRIIRSLPMLLICATFSNQRSVSATEHTNAIVSRLCSAAGNHFFLYVGWNDMVHFRSGLRVPERLLRGKFLIQSNCFSSRREGIGRFEILDVDYG